MISFRTNTTIVLLNSRSVKEVTVTVTVPSLEATISPSLDSVIIPAADTEKVTPNSSFVTGVIVYLPPSIKVNSSISKFNVTSTGSGSSSIQSGCVGSSLQSTTGSGSGSGSISSPHPCNVNTSMNISNNVKNLFIILPPVVE